MIDHVKIPPIFVIAGFTTTILFAVVWIVASAINGEWIFGLNMVSDLGVSPEPAAQILFNYGCVLTGVAGGIFGFGLITEERGALFASGIFTMIGVFFLMGVGAIPESLGTPHSFCAAAFGGFSVLAMICSAIGDWRADRKYYALSSIVLLLVTVAFAIAYNKEFPMFEAVSIICILVWVFVQAYKYFKIFGFVEYENIVHVMLEKEPKQ